MGGVETRVTQEDKKDRGREIIRDGTDQRR